MWNEDTKKSFLFSLSLLIILWVLVGSFSWITNLRKKETSKLMTNIAVQSSRKNEIKTLAKKLVDLNEKIEKTESFLLGPSREDLVKFIEEIEFLGKTAGVELNNSIEVGAKNVEADAKDYEELNLKIETDGSFKQIFHFVSLIENLPYHMRIEQLNLDWSSEEKEKIQKSVWRGEFILKVYKLVGAENS